MPGGRRRCRAHVFSTVETEAASTVRPWSCIAALPAIRWRWVMMTFWATLDGLWKVSINSLYLTIWITYTSSSGFGEREPASPQLATRVTEWIFWGYGRCEMFKVDNVLQLKPLWRKPSVKDMTLAEYLCIPWSCVWCLWFGPARHVRRYSTCCWSHMPLYIVQDSIFSGMFAWFVHILRWKDVAEKVSPFFVAFPSKIQMRSEYQKYLHSKLRIGCFILMLMSCCCCPSIRMHDTFSKGSSAQPQMDSPCNTWNEGFRS